MPIALPSLQLLDIDGADAITFAHAQFSTDIAALPVGHWHWSAWLSPQGRVRYFFALLRLDENRLRLILRGGDAEAMRVALSRFIFRAKVGFHVVTDAQICGCDEKETMAIIGNLPKDDELIVHDAMIGLRLPSDEPRSVILGSFTTDIVASADEINRWRRKDIWAGLPELPPAIQDQFLPQWLGLERLNAINVRKGCYPGQEIMARLHFKGGNKRNLYRIEMDGDELPRIGAALIADDTEEAGILVMAAASSVVGQVDALAVLYDSAAQNDLTCITSAGTIKTKVVSRFS